MDKICKTNPYNREELRNIIHSDISAISGEELQRANIVFHSCTECIESGGHIFSIFCSTGEFLLQYLKVIITANFFLSSFSLLSSEIWGVT